MKLKNKVFCFFSVISFLVICALFPICKVHAEMTSDEMLIQQDVERRRHSLSEDKIELAEALHNKIVTSKTQDFKMWGFSVLFKLYSETPLNPKIANNIQSIYDQYFVTIIDTDNDQWTTVMYRILNFFAHQPAPVPEPIFKMVKTIYNVIIQYMANYSLQNQNFFDRPSYYQLNILRSIIICQNYNLSIDVQNIVSQLNSIPTDGLNSNNVKICYSKIRSNNDPKQVQILKAVISQYGETWGDAIPAAAQNKQGREALICYSKIRDSNAPGPRQIQALKAVIYHYVPDGGTWKDACRAAAQNKQGREALICYSRISGDTNCQVQALEAVICCYYTPHGETWKEACRAAAQNKQGMEALICYSRIPGDTNCQVQALEAVIEQYGGAWEEACRAAARNEQGREALISYSRISGNHQMVQGVQALEAVIKQYGRIWEEACCVAARNEQGREALICYSRIRSNNAPALRQVQALRAVICYYTPHGGTWEDACRAAAQNKQGREALICYSRIQGNNISEQIQALKAIIEQYGGIWEVTCCAAAQNEQGREALICYSRIRSSDAPALQQVQALEAVICYYIPNGGTWGDACRAASHYKQGKEALICYSRIPGNNIPQQVQALKLLANVGYKLSEVRQILLNIRDHVINISSETRTEIDQLFTQIEGNLISSQRYRPY